MRFSSLFCLEKRIKPACMVFIGLKNRLDCSSQGRACTGIAGKLTAKVAVGQAKRANLLAHIKHSSVPGGDVLRMPELVLGMAYYRLRDYF
jgi:hypothetical protein